MDLTMMSLVAQNIVVRSQEPSGFVSRMFLVKKGDSTFRPVFNLKNLNKFLSPKKFRLISHFRIPSFLQRGDYLATIDLSQAYCHVPIAPRHRRYLTFVYNGVPFNWTCLPFGLATAPQVFAQLTNWVASVLREKGIRTIVYLDDFLFAHQDPSCLQEHLKIALHLLRSLGWIINEKKSQLLPSQCVDFLGISWDTGKGLISLPMKKVLLISDLLSRWLQRATWSLSSAQVLIGTLGFAAFSIPLGRLNLRPLQMASRKLPRSSPRKTFLIPVVVMNALRWWKSNLLNSVPLHSPELRAFLSTDASNLGWGAELSGKFCQGVWTEEQKCWHINRKELHAVRAAIWVNRHRLQNHTITLQSDNKTVVSYIRKQGGLKSHSLMQETKNLFLLTSVLNIHILPFYIPGKLNGLADSLSRQSVLPEWHLKPSITQVVFRRWGVPVIDLFASKRSRVVSDYVSRDPLDLQAVFTDAFSRTWSFRLAWVFPPPPLVPQVLHHLNSATGQYLVVVPRWTKVFWRADLKSRAVAPPLVVKDLLFHLVDLSSGLPPSQAEDLILEIWNIRGGPPRSQVGQKRKRGCC
uniref:Polyprotein P3 n=1 Tax=Cacopsylla melanoneura TaxID=428564 RepID=A0A8D8RAW4_9HEMI